MKTDEKVNKIIGANIKKLRKEKGISQNAFAKMIGYTSNSTLNRVEMGKAGVSPRMLDIISKKLQVPISQLTEKSDSIFTVKEELDSFQTYDPWEKINALANLQNKITREIKNTVNEMLSKKK